MYVQWRKHPSQPGLRSRKEDRYSSTSWNNNPAGYIYFRRAIQNKKKRAYPAKHASLKWVYQAGALMMTSRLPLGE
jgi:hypothetical protein